ncbi:2,3-diaminopropionate biosynthesis protein SbnA [Enterococcus sp. DIV0212c]|uniref:pyridoxal-phosphate dependent enzyme n=1 Tax=Enterococcus sp. DIV0212c TaxID=2230867 RepID=UPI001A9A822A|nr:pyridoxal-phosphate dependent enzyme [Enterococcus sp. DIV0212c]MBO1352926.1 pyridoxal-phosphate dependent enzyme [Enterococcus sp. DIV0212c]
MKLSNLVGNTPEIYIDKIRDNQIYGKLEYFNPTCSIKDRAAQYVINNLLASNKITSETKIVESSSGNFGVALAHFCRENKLDFWCVIDPKILNANKKLLKAYGANLIEVTEKDSCNNYLSARLSAVQKFINDNPNSYWMNQYENPLVQEAYSVSLGKEVINSNCDIVFLAVSSCGTIVGINNYLKKQKSNIKVVAVDVEGSVIFSNYSKERFIPGIGSNRKSPILNVDDISDFELVDESESIETCLELISKYSLVLGGSSGAVYLGMKKYLSKHFEINNKKILCIFADGGYKYMDTIYNKL